GVLGADGHPSRTSSTWSRCTRPAGRRGRSDSGEAMLGLSMAARPGGPLPVPPPGAHADDIEIGCGGTILRLAAEPPGLAVDWVVLSGAGDRGGEAGDSAAAFLDGAGERRVRAERF